MFFKFVIIIIFLCFLFSKSYADFEKNSELEEIISYISEQENSIEIQNLLEYYIQSPINLLQTTPVELANLPFFDEQIANEVYNFIKKNPTLKYVDILSELNLSYIQYLILKNCTFIEATKEDKTKANLFYRLRAEPSLKNYYYSEKFLGDLTKFYNRFNIKSRTYNFLLLTAKDIGERNYFDFLSTSFSVKLENFTFVLGDFDIASGLNSVFSSKYLMNKSLANLFQSTKYFNSIYQNRSTLENQFFRGIALNSYINFDSLKFYYNLFFSSKNLSAVYDSTENVITSINKDGYYRTDSEIAKKNVLKEQAFGGFLGFNCGFIEIGFSGLYLNYDKEIRTNSSADFIGKDGLISSLNYKLNFNKFILLGEISADANSNLGIKQSLEINFKKSKLLFHYRNFSKDFRSSYGINYGESTIPNNEMGLMLAFQTKIGDDLLWKCYTDFFKTHSNTYYIPSIVRGMDIASEINYEFDKCTFMLIRAKYKEKTDYFTDSVGVKRIFPGSSYNFRFRLTKKLNDDLRLSLQSDFVLLKSNGFKADENGFQNFAEINIKLFQAFIINSRLCYFHTSSYNSAIWLIEPNVAYNFISSPVFGEGLKYYLTITYNFLNGINLNFKYGYLIKNNVDSLGSGLYKLKDNKMHSIIFQIDTKLPIDWL